MEQPMLIASEVDTALEAALAAERPRLVRLCARLCGDAQAAEDLAQDTLLEAWRARAKVHDPAGLAPWLAAIARNVCLRWRRARGSDLAHHALLADDQSEPLIETLPAEGAEVSLTLERGELAALLDRALALLPAEARTVLVGSYLRELPAAELAARLGLSEGALRVRLHRGRLALRRLLATDLATEAVEYGLAPLERPEWHETRIWCPFCGQHHLRYRIDRETGEYAFHCAGPCDGGAVAGRARSPELVAALSSPKALVTRHCRMLGTSYRQALVHGETCDCGQPVALHHWTPGDMPLGSATPYGIYATCPTCAEVDSASAWHLALDTTAASRFWRRHPRMRALPMRAVEHQGRPALVTGFAATDGQARIEIVSACDTYEVLRVERTDPD